MVTPGEKGVRTQLFHTPPIDPTTLQPDLPNWPGLNEVHWESLTSWEDVARQQGSIERVIPVGGGGGVKKEKEEKEKKEKKKNERRKRRR